MSYVRGSYDLGFRELVSYRRYTADEEIIRSILIDRKEYHLFINCHPKVIFDIGANIGAASLLFANSYPNAMIYAFEPEPENFKILCENVKAYPNVKPFNFALGGKTEKRQLRPSDDEYNLGGFSVHDQGVDMSKPTTEIDVVDIRDVITNEKCLIDLVKIDTEGCEYEILSALKTCGIPPFIMGEMHGVDDWKLFDYLSETHDLRVNRDFGQRCFPFYAMKKGTSVYGLT